MVPIAVDAGGSAQTGHLISSPVAFLTRPAWILRPPPHRARPHLTYLAARLRFVLAAIITMGRVVVATSRRYAE
jgi:hypothetical protein